MSSSSGEWVAVASVDDVKPGEVIEVEVDAEPVVLAHADGEFLATSDICSHAFVMLHDGWLEGEEIECPQHGSRFNMRTGEVLSPPATQPIDVYSVKVEGKTVYVKGPDKS
jgi:nitrite reductase/ring-hydroxylating ferredoxin subunit